MGLARAAAVAEAMGLLAAVVGEAASWATADRRGVLTHLDLAIDVLTTVRAAVLVAERDSAAWEGSGDGSFEQWRGRTSRTGKRVARAQVRQATELGAVPGATTAVIEGRIGLDHAKAIGRIAASSSQTLREAARSPEGQAHLLGLAETMDAGAFETTADRWAAQQDPAGLEHDHQRQRMNRFLHLTQTARGTMIKGQVDNSAGHRLILALEAVTPKPAADDDRDFGQRSADALDTLATQALESGRHKPDAHVPPQVTLILTEETWVSVQSERDHTNRSRATFGFGPTQDNTDGTLGPIDGLTPANGRGSAGDVGPIDGLARADGFGPVNDLGPVSGCGPVNSPIGAVDTIGGVRVPFGGYEPATLEDGTPVPTSELALVMCECDLTRIVIDAQGNPLDLGRSERLFTGVQRSAVIARDRHCAWPQCAQPARWCQIHHLRWWQRDFGSTSVDNGILLCTFHHHEVHRLDLTITRQAVPPADRTGVRRPRGTLATVDYTFTDPTGHVIGQKPGHVIGQKPGAPPDAASPSKASPGSVTPGEASPGEAPPGEAPPGEASPDGAPPGELDWTRKTNPVTGMTEPAFMLE